MIAQELEVSLHMAFVEARQKQHEFITVEHLLLAMLDNPSAAEVLKACGVDLEELRGVLAGQKDKPLAGGLRIGHAGPDAEELNQVAVRRVIGLPLPVPPFAHPVVGVGAVAHADQHQDLPRRPQ